MVWDYLYDGLDPRGVEYSATRRAARSARNTEQAMDDMLELASAPDERTRMLLAQQIRDRRERQARRRWWLRRIDLVVSALIVGGLIWFFATPGSNAPQSVVTQSSVAGASMVPDDANAITSQAQAPDDSDPAVVVQRGRDVLHEAGLTDAQINGAAAQ